MYCNYICQILPGLKVLFTPVLSYVGEGTEEVVINKILPKTIVGNIGGVLWTMTATGQCTSLEYLPVQIESGVNLG